MTTRLKGLVVTFDKDYREDDAQKIIDAIQMLKGVLKVEPVEKNINDYMIREQVKMEMTTKIFNVLKE